MYCNCVPLISNQIEYFINVLINIVVKHNLRLNVVSYFFIT